MKRLRPLLLTLLALLVLLPTGCGTHTPPTVLTVSIAASLETAMGEIRARYSQVSPDVTLDFNVGGSGALQQQIEQGAPADLFFSAGMKQMDILRGKGLLLPGSEVVLLQNELVLITSDSNASIQQLTDVLSEEVAYFALGNPDSVPAGMYGIQSMRSLKLYSRLEERVVVARDVREVLSMVANGHAQAGLVYRTDAIRSDAVRIVCPIPGDSHDPIEYPAAVIGNSSNPVEAKAFLAFVTSAACMTVFSDYGFTCIPADSK